MVVSVVVVIVAALGLATDLALLDGRLKHVAVEFPRSRAGTTWLIVGTDSRASSDAPTAAGVTRNTSSEPGSRADVVLLVRRYRGRLTALSVPRDLLVSPRSGAVQRLALTYPQGPQALVDGLCRSVGVAVTRLVVVNMSGLVEVVDDLGGITVDIPYPVRDRRAGLSIPRAGRQTIDGRVALALVRSRHPKQLISGRWSGSSRANGAKARTTHAGTVLSAMAAAARDSRSNPFVLQQLLWTLTGSLTTDEGTGLFDLRELSTISDAPRDLPAGSVGDGSVLMPDASTRAALRSIGLSGSCAGR